MSTHTAGAGLDLIRELLESGPGGRVFTSEEAVELGRRLDLTPGHTYKLLTELTHKDLIERPRGGLYAMRPPLGGLAPVRALAIAVRAAHPAAVSGQTALAHWGLIDQQPLHEETVSTPTRIRWTQGVTPDGVDRLWHVFGSTIRFRRVAEEAMIGITTVRLDSDTVVPMFDRERTIADVLAMPDGESLAFELIGQHRSDIDVDQLRSYAEHLGVGERLRSRQIPSVAG